MSNERRPRILLVTRNLPPLLGGMERLNWHMAEELAKMAEVRIIGPCGSAALAPPGVTVREAPLAPLWKFLWRAGTLARQEVKAWKPDVVLAGSGLTAPHARNAASKCGARTVVYVHGLDVAVRNPVYRALWFPAIRGADRVIANSRPTLKLCRQIGIRASQVGVVHPGVELPGDQAGTCVDAGAAFRSQHGLGDRPLLLSVGRLSARKGLREFVTRALPRIVAAYPDTKLLVIGDAPSQALHAAAQSPASIQKAADAVGVGEHVMFLGAITDRAELGAAYRAADVHVFPVRQIRGDPEGFGMVAVEAAAYALPTVAFATGGVVDAVAEGVSGNLAAPDDYHAFADATVRLLGERGAMRAGCMEHAARFSWSSFGERIFDQLQQAARSAPC